MWPHGTHNCVPVRIIHARDLSNSSITLMTSKGHTPHAAVFKFSLGIEQIRPACIAPHGIETENKFVPTTRCRRPCKIMKYVSQSKIKNVTILTYIRMISSEYEYFGSARTPVTKSSIYTREHTPPLFCLVQDRSIPRSLQR